MKPTYFCLLGVSLLAETLWFPVCPSLQSKMARADVVLVFLRVLEYYNGILFLTTNRIGKIDPAISSRIHIILHYRRLGWVEIENIFRLNIKRLQEAEQQQH